MNNKKPNLDLAYALETVQDNRELYASWATDYDKDFASSMDYILPNQVAQIFLNMGGTRTSAGCGGWHRLRRSGPCKTWHKSN